MTRYRHVPGTAPLGFPDDQHVGRQDEYFTRENYDPAQLAHHLDAGLVELVDEPEPASDDEPPSLSQPTDSEIEE